MSSGISSHFVREVSVHYCGPRRKLVSIAEPEGVATFVRRILKDNVREHFIAVYLSNAHEVIGYSIVAIGTATSCLASPREIFQPAILLGACALLVSHNHPSGNLRPSDEDKRVTNELKSGADILGIRLLDHVIVTDDSHFSFQCNNLL